MKTVFGSIVKDYTVPVEAQLHTVKSSGKDKIQVRPDKNSGINLSTGIDTP